MTLSQRIRTLSYEEILEMMSIVNKEVTKRQEFIGRLNNTRLKDLPLTINTRALLYRTIAKKTGDSSGKSSCSMNIKELFSTLQKADWERIQHVNAKSFLELQDALNQNGSPLDKYYGVFKSGQKPAVQKSTLREIATLQTLNS